MKNKICNVPSIISHSCVPALCACGAWKYHIIPHALNVRSRSDGKRRGNALQLCRAVDDPFACYSLTPFNEIRKNKESESEI